MSWMMRFVLAMYVVSGGVLWLAGTLCSQEAPNAATQASSQQLPGEESPADPPTTVFPHSETSRLWVPGRWRREPDRAGAAFSSNALSGAIAFTWRWVERVFCWAMAI